MIKILVVDDNAMMRRMLKELIELDENCHVESDVGTSEDALDLLSRENFDVILTDISLQQREGGIDLVKQIRGRGIETPILCVSLHEQSQYEEQLRAVGAQGFLMKQDAIDYLIPAIRDLAEGKTHWQQTVGWE